MTDQDKKQFALMMGTMGAAFRVDPEKETMAVFFHYLKGFPLVAVQYAVDQVIEKEDRFPVVKRLKEYANAYRKPVNYMPSKALQIEEFSQEEVERCKNMDFDDIVKGLAKEKQVSRETPLIEGFSVSQLADKLGI